MPLIRSVRSWERYTDLKIKERSATDSGSPGGKFPSDAEFKTVPPSQLSSQGHLASQNYRSTESS